MQLHFWCVIGGEAANPPVAPGERVRSDHEHAGNLD
jgi:hypothetical protein